MTFDFFFFSQTEKVDVGRHIDIHWHLCIFLLHFSECRKMQKTYHHCQARLVDISQSLVAFFGILLILSMYNYTFSALPFNNPKFKLASLLICCFHNPNFCWLILLILWLFFVKTQIVLPLGRSIWDWLCAVCSTQPRMVGTSEHRNIDIEAIFYSPVFWNGSMMFNKNSQVFYLVVHIPRSSFLWVNQGPWWFQWDFCGGNVMSTQKTGVRTNPPTRWTWDEFTTKIRLL